MFIRYCPKCGKEISHTQKYNRDRLEKEKKLCRECGILKMSESKSGKQPKHFKKWNRRGPTFKPPFIYNCPECNKEIKYSRHDNVLRAQRDKSVCNSCSSKLYKKSWNYVIKDEHIKKMAATKAGYASFEEYMNDLDNKKKYKRHVVRITRQQDLSSLENSEKMRGLCGKHGAYQLDHIISIDEGYKNDIPPEIIGDISNLRIIPWRENLKKSNK